MTELSPEADSPLKAYLHMQQQGQPNAFAAPKPRKRPFVVAAAGSGASMTELRDNVIIRSVSASVRFLMYSLRNAASGRHSSYNILVL